jgi:hypothetical protein
MRIAMMAITTKSSISVNPIRRADLSRRNMDDSYECEKGRESPTDS